MVNEMLQSNAGHRPGQFYFNAPDFSGAPFYLFFQLDKQKTGAQYQSALPINKLLKTLILVLNYLNRTYGFRF